jgi:hypothetical protein
MTTPAETYRASGALNPGSTLAAALGGVVAALVAAGIVWAWESSPIPTLVILTPILQGFVLGFVLMFLFGRAKLRNPTLGFVFGLVCGAISVVAVHYGHYVTDVYAFRDALRIEAAKAAASGSPGAPTILSMVNSDPYHALDEFEIKPMTGRTGFLGHLHVRAKHGVTIKRAEVTGIGMWVLWGIEALIVIGIAAAMGRSRAAEPFCELCDRWFDEVETPTMLPPGKAQELTGVINRNDALGLAALRSSTPHFNPASGATVVKAHVCAGCDDGYADVVLRTPNKEGKMEDKKLATLVRASKEMLAALRADVQPATPQGAAAQPASAGTTTAT